MFCSPMAAGCWAPRAGTCRFSSSRGADFGFRELRGKPGPVEPAHLRRRPVLRRVSVGAAVSAELASSRSAARARDQLGHRAARLLAGYFTYLWCRHRGVSRIGATLAGGGVHARRAVLSAHHPRPPAARVRDGVDAAAAARDRRVARSWRRRAAMRGSCSAWRPSRCRCSRDIRNTSTTPRSC